jgi:hypothetical protein
MRRQSGEQRNISGPGRRDPEIVNVAGVEAARRIAGRDAIVARVCKLAESKAGNGIRVRRVRVRPAWSHEYDERTGVVVDVEVSASDDNRFSYWEALNKSLDALGETLSPADRSWLDSEVSLTVIRS